MSYPDVNKFGLPKSQTEIFLTIANWRAFVTKDDKLLAQTFLIKKVRYRNATLVTSPVKDTNESFSHAHDM